MERAYILFADDVVLNHDIMAHYMKPYAIKINCVMSGREAVEAVREEKIIYNAVFIDQMMPDLDGIQTARKIRELGTKYAGTIPLIAITANQNSDCKYEFLIKGFQDFVQKPIDRNKLDVVIRRWVLPERGETVFGNDDEVLREFMDSFTDSVPNLIQKVISSEADLEEYAVYIHSIKGACLNIRENRLAEKAGELEKAAKLGNRDFVTANSAQFLKEVEEIIPK
jgi:CheY-like chemotaxis protein